MARKKIKNECPLIIEPHPDDYDGYPFITLLQYSNGDDLITIIDDANNKTISAYVLDLCGPEHVNEDTVIQIAMKWYEKGGSDRMPLSVEFSRLGLVKEVSKIYRVFRTDFTTRIIGPLPGFELDEKPKIKRRRRKSIPHGIKVRDRPQE